MNILLATYSYYPYNHGGTEVYVSGLASFLQEQGHIVTIIAGMPPRSFIDHPIFYEDAQLKTIQYEVASVPVIGVVMKNQTVTEIYKKYRVQWVRSWLSVLNEIAQEKWDVLHMHATTSSIGESLIKAAKLHSVNIKIVVSYHVPVSCVKGTLMFGNKMEACNVTPSVNICTACFISSKQNWSLGITRKISSLMPLLANEKLPASLRIKFLVKQFISSFDSINMETDLWHVFSEQIKKLLLLNGVEERKIVLLRHGVNPFFFTVDMNAVIERQKQPVNIFLFASRFEKVKGFFTILNAWFNLPESKDRKLWIIGENQTGDDEVEKYVRLTLQREDIIWLGVKNQEEVSGIMKKVHCTIIPSEWVEIGPLVFHEAIAAGSDVIASDMGGCEELAQLYSTKSHLFETGNTDSLTKAILEFKYSGSKEIPQTREQNYRAVLHSYIQVLNN